MKDEEVCLRPILCYTQLISISKLYCQACTKTPPVSKHFRVHLKIVDDIKKSLKCILLFFPRMYKLQVVNKKICFWIIVISMWQSAFMYKEIQQEHLMTEDGRIERFMVKRQWRTYGPGYLTCQYNCICKRSYLKIVIKRTRISPKKNQ